ncbi:MAG: TIGR02117 family protein [Sphingomicrobium sp.]
MARRRRKSKRLLRRSILVLAAVPALYLLAALIGSLVPVNRAWREPDDGITIYLADNGVHSDIIMPAAVNGLEWAPLLPKSDFAGADPAARWVAFGSGEERVYLETPRWRDIKLATLWSALSGGNRVMHVEWVGDPSYATREIRLRPEEYRRLWAAVRSDFGGPPKRLGHPGYGPSDAFYRATGKANAIRTCNSWSADRLRLAGIRTSAWPPFVQGLLWRYRLSSPNQRR